MAESQTWRVVLATGEVLSVEVQEFTRGLWIAVCGHRETFSYATPEDALRAFLAGYAVDAGVREILAPGEPTRAELVAELAVLRAQLAPLVACVDALRAAARAAGWRDADATGETLVAWVRRGAMQEAHASTAPKVRALRTAINALCDVRTLRSTCTEGETWRAHVHDKDWTDARVNALAVLNAMGGE